MKKLVSILAAAVLGAAVLAPTAAAEDLPQVTCEAYVVMDADTGQVIMEKNPDEVLYPASITKIMTLGLTMEKAQGDWSAQLTIDYDVAHSLESNSTHIALLPGEVVTLEDVIYGTQLESANDGANALAEYFGDDGTIASGVEKMNAKAQELGCNKIALGHHFSDVVETTLLGLFYGAQLQAMPPKLKSRNFPGMELIRPLYCVHEDAIIAWKNYNGLRFLQCACRFTEARDASGDGVGESKRQEMKVLLRQLKKTNPNIEKSIFRAIHGVQLDTFPGFKYRGKAYSFLDDYDGTAGFLQP